MLGFCSYLEECLCEDVVFVLIHKLRYISQNPHYIELPLIYGLRGQEDVLELKPKQIVAHAPNLLVGFHVMHVEGVYIVKVLVQTSSDFGLQVDYAIKDSELLKVNKLEEVLSLVFEGVLPLNLFNQHEVSIDPQEVFELSLQRNHILLFELIEDVLLVVQKYLLCLGEMNWPLQHYS